MPELVRCFTCDEWNVDGFCPVHGFIIEGNAIACTHYRNLERDRKTLTWLAETLPNFFDFQRSVEGRVRRQIAGYNPIKPAPEVNAEEG